MIIGAAGAGRHGLPRHHCRGLIEAPRKIWKWLSSSGHVFRGITAAASLKRDAPRIVRDYLESLPRHHCRGLIEAAPGPILYRVRLSVFRGITAAASLKRGGPGCAACRARGLPRHHCRGLIEALMSAALIGLVPVVFRGITAAASLKPSMPARSLATSRTVFRGITAAASLKRYIDRCGTSPRPASSAASLPRPH